MPALTVHGTEKQNAVGWGGGGSLGNGYFQMRQ